MNDSMRKITKETYQARVNTWLAALRDPERKQAKKLLNSGHGMCCLGVACDVVESKWEYEYVNIPEIRKDTAKLLFWNGTDSWGHLPKTVIDYYGFRSRNAGFDLANAPIYEKDGQQRPATSLAVLNDSLGWSFTQIADFVEANKAAIFIWASESGT